LDSVYLSIDKKENKWLGRNVKVKTVIIGAMLR
jgi:hypothetical protein